MSNENTDNFAKYFNRIYRFRKNDEWILPDKTYSSVKFTVADLQDMKRELNDVKGLLGEFDLNEWSKHTHFRDASSYIIGTLKQKIKPELITQAWCKFYEILANFPVISEDSPTELLSVHLCEAPGAFVCALNHYLALNYPEIQWHWLANSLNPEYEGNALTKMIPDDRLIRHTRSNWYFGLDNTGDIQKFYNFTDLTTRINSKEKCFLVTADGSVNCMDDPGEQERNVEFLHYCETMVALAVLQNGGNFVLKIFTIFEDSTVCLLYLLNCVFKNVSVFKPCSSKSGNSELYLICESFSGFEALKNAWETLLRPYKNGRFEQSSSMFSYGEIPESFFRQVFECNFEFFVNRQTNAIKENVYFFKNKHEIDAREIHKLKKSIAERFVKKFKLFCIPKFRKIVPYVRIHENGKNFEFLGGGNSVDVETIIPRDDGIFLNNVCVKIGKRIDAIFITKFGNLEKCWEIQEKSSELYEIVLNRLKANNIVLNANNFDIKTYHAFQREFFEKIRSNLDENKNMIFVNVPFFTRFFAGLWYVLAYGFRKIYFANGFSVFLEPVPQFMSTVKHVLNRVDEKYENIDCEHFFADILQIVKPEVFDNPRVMAVLNKINEIPKKIP